MTRIVRAATISANTTTTATTIRAAIERVPFSLVHDERRCAPDLDDLDALSHVDHLILVVAASSPHLTVDLHAPAALLVGDPLEHERALTHQRRRTRPDRRREPAMAAS